MNDTLKTPTHLWIVGGLSALWYAFCTYSCLLTVTHDAATFSSLSQQQRAYFESFPLWANAAWVLGTVGGLVGALLLFARSRHSVMAFALSLAGLLGVTVFQFALVTPPAEMAGTGMLVLNLFIWAVAIALFLYARKQGANGVLG